MDISKIAEYYELKDLNVTAEQLLLDPRNPRIAIDLKDEVHYTQEELVSPDVQDYTLSIINTSEHHIAELINSIRTAGFLPGLHEIIVKRVLNSNKYLVLEGNRRLTAIKFLLNEKGLLEQTVLKTLQKLPVKEFVFTTNQLVTEEETIDILLGSIHIKGPRAWGPIEKALYVYKSYKRELEKEFGENSEFVYIDSFGKKTGEFFNFQIKEIKKLLGISRIYEQLKNNGYGVRADNYTLIELAIGEKRMSNQYFEFDKFFNFSAMGLEKFNRMCIVPTRVIRNPKDFKTFVTIYNKGNNDDLHLVETRAEPLSRILQRVKNRQSQKAFVEKLTKIRNLLEGIAPTDYQGNMEETMVAKEIKSLVDSKLTPLTRRIVLKKQS
jgi:hypothetical protein